MSSSTNLQHKSTECPLSVSSASRSFSRPVPSSSRPTPDTTHAAQNLVMDNLKEELEPLGGRQETPWRSHQSIRGQT
ncbi:hypothetical protein AOLI_G00137710 [Acnodon oligacanthus]